MTFRVSVLAFRQGEPLHEYVARSETKTPQEIVDWMYTHANEGITFRFLGAYGVLHPSTPDPNQIDL